jgi:hypothetical protein
MTKEQPMSAPCGTESEGGRRPTGDPVPAADTEVSVVKKRRRHTRAYKVSVLEKVAELKKSAPGEIGEYLRSEGLYYGDVRRWQVLQQDGDLSGYPKGSAGYVRETMSTENAKLKRQIASMKKRLEQAELLLELQKKVSQLILNESQIDRSE